MKPEYGIYYTYRILRNSDGDLFEIGIIALMDTKPIFTFNSFDLAWLCARNLNRAAFAAKNP